MSDKTIYPWNKEKILEISRALHLEGCAANLEGKYWVSFLCPPKMLTGTWESTVAWDSFRKMLKDYSVPFEEGSTWINVLYENEVEPAPKTNPFFDLSDPLHRAKVAGLSIETRLEEEGITILVSKCWTELSAVLPFAKLEKELQAANIPFQLTNCFGNGGKTFCRMSINCKPVVSNAN